MKITILLPKEGHSFVQPTEVDVEPGDRVLLHTTGFAHVPKWLGGSWATVLSVNSRALTLKVQAEQEIANSTRTILPQNIRKLEKKSQGKI